MIDLDAMEAMYENHILEMVEAGRAWMKANPDKLPWVSEVDNSSLRIIGSAKAENEHAKELMNAMNDNTGGGCTGAQMHRAVKMLRDEYKFPVERL